jgi:hypothetical protein
MKRMLGSLDLSMWIVHRQASLFRKDQLKTLLINMVIQKLKHKGERKVARNREDRAEDKNSNRKALVNLRKKMKGGKEEELKEDEGRRQVKI